MRAAWCAGRSAKYPKYWCSNRECDLYAKTIKRDDIEGAFENLLQEIKPEARTVEAARRRLMHRWQTRFDDVTDYHASLTKEAQSIAKQINELVDCVPTASRTVADAYERRIDELELKRAALDEKQSQHSPDNFDYRTAFERVTTFIKNPYKRWKSGIIEKQQLVLDMCFLRDVKYHPKQAYYTAHLSPTFGVLTNNIAVSEGALDSPFLSCGPGRNRTAVLAMRLLCLTTGPQAPTHIYAYSCSVSSIAQRVTVRRTRYRCRLNKLSYDKEDLLYAYNTHVIDDPFSFIQKGGAKFANGP